MKIFLILFIFLTLSIAGKEKITIQDDTGFDSKEIQKMLERKTSLSMKGETLTISPAFRFSDLNRSGVLVIKSSKELLNLTDKKTKIDFKKYSLVLSYTAFMCSDGQIEFKVKDKKVNFLKKVTSRCNHHNMSLCVDRKFKSFLVPKGFEINHKMILMRL